MASTGMTTTTTDDVSNTITTFAMTAIFTPPPSCSSSWTYEPEAANDVYGGLLLQNAAPDDNANPSCFPLHFDNYGRKTASAVFSPGFCPVGYTSANLAIDQPVTTAVCCLSDYTYYTMDGGNGVYAGCTRMFPSTTSTLVTIRQSPGHSTEITGPITMWAQPITIELQSSDSNLFTTQSTATTDQASVAVSTQSTRTASKAPSAASTNSATQSVSGSSGQGHLSAGADVGLGVGVGVGTVMLAAIAFWMFRRHRAAKRNAMIKSPYQSPNHDETQATIPREKTRDDVRELDSTRVSVSRNIYELGV
ncbi:hypothetical protein DTO271D3_3144 [Paecilomyces variotii]|nr:hypothetical protein DTO195F2_3937 [Paecilomyces variotii]KAJ9316637.1 hypothetical protein DTO271D3_3144 [Paecilomyces variotii]